MRSSSSRSLAHLSMVVPKREPDDHLIHPPVSPQDEPPTGTDLSLPPEIATALGGALAGFRFALERSDTAQGLSHNIHFHRIVGRSEAGEGSAALLYFDQSRLEKYEEPWFVYAMSIRIRKCFCTREHDRLGIIILAPEGTQFPGEWPQHCNDIKDLKIVRDVRFSPVARAPLWMSTSGIAKRAADEWTRTLDLLPLSEVQDTFGSRGETTPQQATQSIDTPAPPADAVPKVFISYAREDEEWLDKLLDAVGSLAPHRCHIWTDREISAGSDWAENIEANLEAAQIIIFLVSESFLGSKYIQTVEMKRALEAAEKKKKTILWVYIRQVFEMDPRIERWQAAHRVDEPIECLAGDRQNAQFREVFKSLVTSLKKIAAPRAQVE